MKSNINVLYLSSWYPTRVAPTNGNFVEKHAVATSRYCNVAVLHVRSDKNMNSKYETTFDNSQNINVLISYFKSPNSKISFINNLITTFRYAKSYLKGYKAIKNRFGKQDIVHLNVIYPAGIIALLLKKFAKIPYIITEHWSGYTQTCWATLSKQNLIVSKIISRNAAIVLPVTKNLGENMQSLGIEGNYSTINNVVNTNVFALRNSLNDGEKKRIIHISDIKDDHKNFSGILHAIKQLSERRNDFVLDVITDGSQENARKLTTTLNILDRFVIIHGEKSADQIAQYLKNSAFLVLFSNYENFPCVIVEAMACGVPVLSTDVGGIKEHLSEEFGILIKKGDNNALVEAMDKMLDTCSQYDSVKLRQYATENFSFEAVGAKIHNLYSTILAH